MDKRHYIAIPAAIFAGLAISANAYQIRQTRTGSVIRWDRAEFPIHYYIDSNHSMPEGAVVAVIRAFQSWENIGAARLSFVYMGMIKNPAVANDGKNCIIWVEKNWRHGPGTIAHTTTWYSLDDGGIVNCDIEINAQDYDWSTVPSERMLDIQNAIAHEVGHLLGLDDVLNSLNETMFGFILRGETKKRSLDIDDIRATSFLYPLSATFEAIEASSIDPERQSLSPLLTPRDTPGGINIIFISSCDWDRNGTMEEIAAISYEEESGFAFHIYKFPDSGKGESDITTLAKDDWIIAAGNNTRGMAVVDADRDGFRDEIAIIKDTEEGESVISVYEFSSTMDTPSLLCSTSLGKSDSTINIAAMSGTGLCLLRKINGRDYNFSIYDLDAPKGTLSRRVDYGALPIEQDEEILSIFPLEYEPSTATAFGILMIDRRGRAHIDFMEPGADGGLVSSLSIQLSGSSPVLATSIDLNGDGLLNEIVLITE